MAKRAALELTDVYREEVARLISARQHSKLIHGSGDIDASGDEIEVAFRDLLRRKLPSQYFVGHGHVVDESLAVSPQVVVKASLRDVREGAAVNAVELDPYQAAQIFSASFKASSSQHQKEGYLCS